MPNDMRTRVCCLRVGETPEFPGPGRYVVGAATYRNCLGDSIGRFENPGIIEVFEDEGFFKARLQGGGAECRQGKMLRPTVLPIDTGQEFAAEMVLDDGEWWVSDISWKPAGLSIYLAAPPSFTPCDPGRVAAVPATLSCHHAVRIESGG